MNLIELSLMCRWFGDTLAAVKGHNDAANSFGSGKFHGCPYLIYWFNCLTGNGSV
jgi:hypothetical protein